MEEYLGSKVRRGLFALGGSVPEVDRLSVRVVTDSYHHAFEPSRDIGGVAIERFSFPFSPKPPSRTLQNEWGLSLHVESRRGAESRQVLVDFGYTAETLDNNLRLLGVDPARLDALVLSHGHYDHFGGMAGFLGRHGRKIRPRLPFVLGGEECYCFREARIGNAVGSFGVLDRHAIAKAKLKVVTAERPLIIAGHGFSTGWIPLTSFEKVLSPTRMTVGMKGGLGARRSKLPKEKRTATVIPDDFQHEHATCYHVKGKGLVVMTSCGHRGVVNSAKAAIAVSGVSRIHAVIGGFHLAPHPPEYVAETVKALKALEPDFVIPMHCTGEKFIELAQQEMPGKFIRSSTGTRFSFGAPATV